MLTSMRMYESGCHDLVQSVCVCVLGDAGREE